MNNQMPRDVGSIQYSLREPFDRAVELVCRSLESKGLRVAGELDVAKRVERYVGIVLSPCKIVFVLPGESTLTKSSIHPSSTIFLPLHIVISNSGGQTEIEVQNRVQSRPETAEPAVIGPIVELQTQISSAIEAIAMRPSLV